MPLGDIAGDIFGGILRLIMRIIFEIVIEFLIRGAGHLILGLIRPKSESSETAATFTGLAFWAVTIALAVFLYKQTVAA